MMISILTLAVFTSVLVPGLIFRKTRSRFFVTAPEPTTNEAFLSYAVSGLACLAVSWPLMAALGFNPLAMLVASGDPVIFFAVISMHPGMVALQLLVAPVVLAIFTAYLERQAWSHAAMAAIGLPPMPRQPTALSAAAGFQMYVRDPARRGPQAPYAGHACLLDITLRSGSRVVGLMGAEGCITSNRGYPDVFLEQEFVKIKGPNGPDFIPDPLSTGVVILGSQISTISFRAIPPCTRAGDPETVENTGP